MTTIAELFSKKVDIRTTYMGVELIHHLSETTSEQDLEFRRRSSRVEVVGREARAADKALDAPRWLYDQICEGVTAEIEGRSEDVPDFRDKIPVDLKVAVANAFLDRFAVIQKPRGIPCD